MSSRNVIAMMVLLIGCQTDVGVQQQQNVDPTAQITSPSDGAGFDETETIQFFGAIGDNNGLDDIASVTWTSSRDGQIGESPPGTEQVELSTALSAGSHTITLSVSDNRGGVGTHAISVVVQGAVQAPAVLITSPQQNGLYLSTEPIQLAGEVGDVQQTPDTLSLNWAYTPVNGGARTVISSASADSTGTVEGTWTDPTPGAWMVELEATDSDGNVSTDDVAVIVMHPDEADLDADGYPGATDCDDSEFDVNPGRNEQCNGVDTDCSGEIDDKDIDGDGHIDENCDQYAGGLPVDDCADTNAFIYTGATEQADNADNNCDGRIDEGTNLYDDDGDCACESPTICNGSDEPTCLSLEFNDCDDTDAAMNHDDADNDGASTCAGDCDDTDSDLNLSDFDNDLYSTCAGDCNDFDPLLIPLTCP